jgi:LemA protein
MPSLSLLTVFLVVTGTVLMLHRYNGLVRAQKRVQEAWSSVDVQLKRRNSLLPNLVETVKGYAAHERDVFEEVARARSAWQSAATAGQTASADSALTTALGRLLAVVESYPQLHASDNFMGLRADLSAAEEKIAFARQFYNRNVLDYNTRLGTFPDSIVGILFAFQAAEFFEAEPKNRGDLRVSFSTTASTRPEPEPPASAA